MSKQVRKEKNHNPTGKGGFKDHPELIFRDYGIKPLTWRAILNRIGMEAKKLKTGDYLTRKEEIAKLMYKEAKKDIRAWLAIMAREEGNPEQPIGGTNELPAIKIIYTTDDTNGDGQIDTETSGGNGDPKKPGA